ncbi:DUF3043 domain-containing protein [Aestuariimicrobium soli]|uniref:DUF3043 domain-containing protein n=1 Tax=Aestuariimicrobium soli TaxID=2035834 RepID=UPI003EBC33D4
MIPKDPTVALFRPYQQTTADERAEAKAKASAEQAEAALKEKQERRESLTASRQAAVVTPDSSAPQAVGGRPTARLTPKKDRPTPTRAEAEAARKARVNPQLSPKEAKQQLRERNRTARLKAMAEQENEPTKQLLRDYIDHRWTITEFLMPTMILLAAGSIAFGRYLLAQQLFSLAMLALFAAWVINVWWVWRGFKKQAKERLAQPNFRGLLMYANNRMLQIRRFRQPPARIKRGESY